MTAAEPPTCSADAIGADTGDLAIDDVSCLAGWATGLIDECPQGQDCEGVDVFHLTETGWVRDGYFPAVCAEGLTGSGMSIHTAAGFVSRFCADPPLARTGNVPPGSTGERVVQLQVALVAEGYPIDVDGTYGPRTQAAVRDFQRLNGLEVDGIAGPRTQAALGIGPGGRSATPPATVSPPPAPVTTAPAGPTSTLVVPAGAPVVCSAAAIAADIGRSVAEIADCHAGWAVGSIEPCPSGADCNDVDVFHVTDAGWVDDGPIDGRCAESLADAGMSPYTAASFIPFCNDPAPPSRREIIAPGSSGALVTALQIALVDRGYPLVVDGTYGPRTQAAVRDFQLANGLELDGIAGPDTRTSLGV